MQRNSRSLVWHRRVRRYLPAALLLASGWRLWLSETPTPATPDASRYAGLLQPVVGHRPGETPAVDAAAIRLLEFVIADARRCIPAGGNVGSIRSRRMDHLYRAAEARVGCPTRRYAQFGPAQFRTTFSQGGLAVIVSAGAVFRLALFGHDGRRLAVPGPLAWAPGQPANGQGEGCGLPSPLGWRAHRAFFGPNGTLILVSSTDSDLDGGHELRANILRLVGTRGEETRTLRWVSTWGLDAAWVSDASLTIHSDQRALSFAAGGPWFFWREEEFAMADGQLRLTRRHVENPELLFLDRWVANAWSASRPTALQARCRRLLPAGMHYGGPTARELAHRRIEVTYEAWATSAPVARFVLAPRGGSYMLLDVRRP